MEPIEIIFAVLNIIAIVLVPIVAVIVGQKLQDRTDKRKDKLTVFKVLMANRSGWSSESAYPIAVSYTLPLLERIPLPERCIPICP